MKRGPGRPRKRPLEVAETEVEQSGGNDEDRHGDQVDIRVYDLAPPDKKSKQQKGESSSKSSASVEETPLPVLRRSNRRRSSVKEIKDKEEFGPSPSTVFDTPPATSIKSKPCRSRKKQGSAAMDDSDRKSTRLNSSHSSVSRMPSSA